MIDRDTIILLLLVSARMGLTHGLMILLPCIMLPRGWFVLTILLLVREEMLSLKHR